MPAVDFNAALVAARRRMKQPRSSVDDAMTDANQILTGGKVFEPMDAVSGQRCDDWMDTGTASLLQHHLIHADGWTQPPAVRLLSRSAPYPPYLQSVASQLSSLFDGQPPDCCEVWACEPGQQPAQGSASGSCAVLALNGECQWSCTSRDGTQTEVTMPSRSVIVLPPEHAATTLLPARQRQITLHFRRSD